ncbi:uncharacterized protein LOC111269133 isoform X2 [Varroa jacobsoni]|uniref:uncharacterized protein LOC111269133 isoform X2 n=1 Tax=Varroa jacobsoni TaxID=62625 RepID=UPI000BFA0261|nr:uncharacterized protein LOC111269133 isoform X2 [Varroa jacobsoni]
MFIQCIFEVVCLSGQKTGLKNQINQRGATSGITSAGEPVLLRPYAISLLTRPSTLTASRGIPFVQRMVRSEYASHPFSFLKRGVMMGVDLPDFIMNQQNGNRIQAFRNRLIQSGRR